MLGIFMFIVFALGVLYFLCKGIALLAKSGRAARNVIDRNDPKSPRYRG